MFFVAVRKKLRTFQKFNARGYYTAALAGDASEKHREACIDLLTKEVSEEEIQIHEKAIKNKVSCELEEMPYLDYIFTIDIFNEGVEVIERNNKKCRIYAA